MHGTRSASALTCVVLDAPVDDGRRGVRGRVRGRVVHVLLQGLLVQRRKVLPTPAAALADLLLQRGDAVRGDPVLSGRQVAGVAMVVVVVKVVVVDQPGHAEQAEVGTEVVHELSRVGAALMVVEVELLGEEGGEDVELLVVVMVVVLVVVLASLTNGQRPRHTRHAGQQTRAHDHAQVGVVGRRAGAGATTGRSGAWRGARRRRGAAPAVAAPAAPAAASTASVAGAQTSDQVRLEIQLEAVAVVRGVVGRCRR